MRNLCFIGVLFFLSITYCLSQNQSKEQLEKGRKALTKNLISKEYYNKFILENKRGEMFIVDSLSNYKIVFVKWENGYFSIGELSFGYAFGEWNTYDKKNRLRKRVGFGNNGEMLLYLREFDRKGRLIKNSESSVPF